MILELGPIFGVAGVVEAVEHLEHFLSVAEGETAVHAVAVGVVDGRANEIVLEKVFGHAGGVGAKDAVGLEEEEVFVRS